MPDSSTLFLQRDNTELHCGVWKADDQAPWILLLNGYGRPMSDFKGLIRTLTAADINCISLDVRGSGQTKTADDFQLTDILEDIYYLLETYEITELSVLGISMGGLLTQALYFNHQSNLLTFKSIFLVSTCSDTKWLRKDLKVYGQPLEQTVAALSEYFSAGFLARNDKLVVAMAKDIIKNASHNIENKSQQSKAIRDLNFTQQIPSITSPVYLMHGTDDKIIAFDAAKEADQLIKNSKLMAYEEIGHLFIAECPKRFYEDVKNIILSQKETS